MLFQRLALKYVQSITKNPIQTKLLTCCILTPTANVISQIGIENTSASNFDYGRLRKVLSASLILTILRHYQFTVTNKLIPQEKSGISTIIKQLAVDQLLFAPLLNALFFILMALQNQQTITLTSIKSRLWPTMKMYWKIWPAAKLVSFLFIPVIFQPLFFDLIGFFWAIFLSTKTKKK